MSRDTDDFCRIRGDIAFLNGIFTAYMEEILYPVIKDDNSFVMHIDLFSIGDEEEKRIDVALSEHIKNYLELGQYDYQNNFIPVSSSDDFHFHVEDNMRKANDEILIQELYSLLKIYASSDRDLLDAVRQFVLRTHQFLYSTLSGIYMAKHDVLYQLNKNMHFQKLIAGALFMKFDTFVMLLTIGYDG